MCSYPRLHSWSFGVRIDGSRTAVTWEGLHEPREIFMLLLLCNDLSPAHDWGQVSRATSYTYTHCCWWFFRSSVIYVLLLTMCVSRTQPWCYTDALRQRWGYCDLDIDVLQGNSKEDDKCHFPFTYEGVEVCAPFPKRSLPFKSNLYKVWHLFACKTWKEKLQNFVQHVMVLLQTLTLHNPAVHTMYWCGTSKRRRLPRRDMVLHQRKPDTLWHLPTTCRRRNVSGGRYLLDSLHDGLLAASMVLL
jgi:hypothetical protein